MATLKRVLAIRALSRMSTAICWASDKGQRIIFDQPVVVAPADALGVVLRNLVTVRSVPPSRFPGLRLSIAGCGSLAGSCYAEGAIGASGSRSRSRYVEEGPDVSIFGTTHLEEGVLKDILSV